MLFFRVMGPRTWRELIPISISAFNTLRSLGSLDPANYGLSTSSAAAYAASVIAANANVQTTLTQG